MPAFSYEKNDALWDVLRRNPAGVTANAAAVMLKWDRAHASARLGKLAMYGAINRVPIAGAARPQGGGSCQYRYQMKQRGAHV